MNPIGRPAAVGMPPVNAHRSTGPAFRAIISERQDAGAGHRPNSWPLGEKQLGEQLEVRNKPRGRESIRLASALAAALWFGTCLTPAAFSADASNQMCPQESPLGGWVRMQHLAQTRWGDGGCNQVTNVFMTFDLVFDGPSFEWLVARLPPQMPPQVRQKVVNDMLAARIGLRRKATKLKYKIWTTGCHPVGGPGFTCSGRHGGRRVDARRGDPDRLQRDRRQPSGKRGRPSLWF